MRVMKFGGSSLESPERMQSVLEIIRERQAANESIVVVVSALGETTSQIQEMACLAAKADLAYQEMAVNLRQVHRSILTLCSNEEDKRRIASQLDILFEELGRALQGIVLIREASPKTRAYLMSFGERLSAYVLSELLQSEGMNATFVDARELIVTDEQHLNARVDMNRSLDKLRSRLSETSQINVLTGFIAATQDGETTTLGRGGSDYTAALAGMALGADLVEIWTDVDGVMSADPKFVKKAVVISAVTYEEMMELSHFGARVLYPPTIGPLLEKNIPIRIKNTLNPEGSGTMISREAPQTESAVTGIASIPEVALLQIQGTGMIGVAGIAARLFRTLADERVNVIMISQASSEHSICFAIPPADVARAESAIAKEFAAEMEIRQIDPVQVTQEMSIVAVVGRSMRHRPGIAGHFFQALGKNGVNVVAIAQGSSEFNISVVVSRSNEGKALRALHDSFFLSEVQTLNVFQIGVGLVGRTLLEQIQEQQSMFKSEQGLDVRVVALANSRQMTFDPEGIPLCEWKDRLENRGQPSNVDDFVRKMIDLKLPNNVFVDCTASEKVASTYSEILRKSVSVVSPNKRANTGSYAEYEELHRTHRHSNVKFFFETNVGAGLPIISTIRSLRSSGDKIARIEAVLSGTMSYIFNTFSGQAQFSDVVRNAKERGLTEPNPSEDLSGEDVRRKLLILAREIGLPLEEDDIQVQSLIPSCVAGITDPAEFMEKLCKADEEYDHLKKEAADCGKRLCYIGTIQDGKAQVSLDSIDPSHPFFDLQGTDNIIALTTRRYHETPLVVRGPGAGAGVTAAGVLADILRSASYII